MASSFVQCLEQMMVGVVVLEVVAFLGKSVRAVFGAARCRVHGLGELDAVSIWSGAVAVIRV